MNWTVNERQWQPGRLHVTGFCVYIQSTIIMKYAKALKDRHNEGRCFTKNKVYELPREVYKKSDLIDITLVNDNGVKHRIGLWYKSFRLVEQKDSGQ